MHHRLVFARSRASRPTPGTPSPGTSTAPGAGTGNSHTTASPGAGWGGREDRFRASLRTSLRASEILVVPVAAAYCIHRAVMGVARTVLGRADFELFAHSFLRFVISCLLCSVVVSACVLIAGVLTTRRRARAEEIQTAAATRRASTWRRFAIRVPPHAMSPSALLPVPRPLGSPDPILRPLC